MSKYHVNDKGETKACRAQEGKCPFGGASEHFDDQAAARSAAEKKLEQQYSEVPTVTKTKPRTAMEIAAERSEKKNGTMKKEVDALARHIRRITGGMKIDGVISHDGISFTFFNGEESQTHRVHAPMARAGHESNNQLGVELYETMLFRALQK